MAQIKKMGFVVKVRRKVDPFILSLPLPRVHPDLVSVLSLVASFAFVSVGKFWQQFFLLLLVLLLDWLDGAVAKKHKFRKNEGEKRKGWLVDVVIDRLSELLIFMRYFVWMPLVILNIVLSFVSYKTGRHFILPLRQVLLIYIFVMIFV